MKQILLAVIVIISFPSWAISAAKFTLAQDQTFTSVVFDCSDGSNDPCIQIPAGATGIIFDRTTVYNSGGTAVDADETLGANAIQNSVWKGNAANKDLVIDTGNSKMAAGDYNAFPNHASAPTGYTDGGHSVFATDPLFTDEATGDYSLTAGSPMIDVGTGTTADINSVAGAGNGYADTPTNATPADAATKIARKPTLTASAVSITGGTDIGAYEFVSATHTGSQWQVCSDALCASAVYDSGDDAVNLETIGVTNRLDPKTTYYFRVRYETDAGWSEWSTITEFETRSIGGGHMELGLGLSLN